ncbi:MAG: hypothetical protein AAB336_04375 [Acidobacteriota bacterium]
MDFFRLDARQIDNVNLNRFSNDVKFDFKTSGSNLSKPLVKSALASKYPVALQAAIVSEDKPNFAFLPPQKTPTGFMNNSNHFFTVGIGISGGFSLPFGIFAGAGVYGSNTGEFGTYTGAGIQIASNMGGSASIEATYIFGPPSDFQGMAYGIGIEIEPCPPICVAGSLLFQPKTWRFLGFTFSVGVGVSALPANILIQAGMTNTKPRLIFR